MRGTRQLGYSLIISPNFTHFRYAVAGGARKLMQALVLLIRLPCQRERFLEAAPWWSSVIVGPLRASEIERPSALSSLSVAGLCEFCHWNSMRLSARPRAWPPDANHDALALRSIRG